jgi:hypothetical protein
MNNQNKVFQPTFYKGTTFANYKEAMHVLSCNNCVLMDDLFGNQSTKTNCDALVAKKIDDKIGIERDENQLYEESLVNDAEDQLYFESASIKDILSPNQNPNDLSRYQNNIMT